MMSLRTWNGPRDKSRHAFACGYSLDAPGRAEDIGDLGKWASLAYDSLAAVFVGRCHRHGS